MCVATYLAVIRSRGNQIVIERVPVRVSGRSEGFVNSRCLPVGVQNNGSVASTQRDAVWELAPFFKRNNRKGATTTCFPIDRDMLRVDLDSP
jgi:hypothetical protein